MIKLWKDSRICQKVCQRQRSDNYLELSKENMEYESVTLTILYLEVLHDMVSKNCLVNFSKAAVMS